MNHFAHRGLAAANRLAKRLLGVQQERTLPPAAPFFLETAGQPPSYAKDARRGTWVFVLQYVTRGAGGLADILHLGEELEKQYGLAVQYHVMGGQPLDYCRDCIRWTLPSVREEQVVEHIDFVPEFLCATAWPTAYYALNLPSKRKFYFVQDYEPWFHRAGLSQYYAEKSYNLGLEMFTLGPWLADHLAGAHGGRAQAMPFPASDPADPGRSLAERKTVAMYVQPDKEHRGTELMIEGARRLSEPLRERGLELVLFGSRENEHLALDFPCTVRGVLHRDALQGLLRETRVGICASFSNVSLMTFRFMTFGCMTLDMERAGIRRNVPLAAEPLIRYFAPTPGELATAALHAADHPASDADRHVVARTIAEQHSWVACARSLQGCIESPFARRD